MIPKDPEMCTISRNLTSPLSKNDVLCINIAYFGESNRCPTISPTLSPTEGPLDFCLYGDHSSDVNDSSTRGYFFMGHYTQNGSYNGKPTFVQHRTSYQNSRDYPFKIFWTGNNWGIYSYVGEHMYSYCNNSTSIEYPRDCGNNWITGNMWPNAWPAYEHTNLNTKRGECDIVRCQSIDVKGIYWLGCVGTFGYISDNLYGDINSSVYWAYNDYLGQWLCGDTIEGISGSYRDMRARHVSEVTTFPILYDGGYYTVPTQNDKNQVITILCNGCVGTPSQCASYNVTTKPPTAFESISPTVIPTITPTVTPTDIPTNTPSFNPSSYPTDVPSFNPSIHPTLYPSETPTESVDSNTATNTTASINPSIEPTGSTILSINDTKMDTTTMILVIVSSLAIFLVTILVCLLMRVCYRKRKNSNNMNKEKGDIIEINSVTPKCLSPIQSTNTNDTNIIQYRKPTHSNTIVYDSLPRNIDEGQQSSDDSDAKSTECQPRFTITEDVRINQVGNQQSGLLLVTARDANKDSSFKIYYQRLFDGVLLQYYENIVQSRLNDIDTLILLDNIDDLNQYNIIINKFHQIKFINIVKQIKIERHKWIKCLKKVNIYYDYINVFDKHGIYTINEFKKRFKNVDELNDLINNVDVSKKLYNIISKKY